MRTKQSNLSLLLVCTLLVLAALLPAVAHAQAILNVGPGQPYTTIQSAINAAHTGDTVLVAPGTYNENINFNGKAITVTSSAGPASTIIDGGYLGAAVTFSTGEPRASVLSNLTIQHGGRFGESMSAIGGIYVGASSPTLLNNVLLQNRCWGIETSQAAPLIQGNQISTTLDPQGLCSFGGGSAIYIGGNLSSSNPTARNGTPPFIVGNTIQNNTDSGHEDAGGNGGAAIAVWGGTPIIQNNILRNNASPGGSGGAINVQYGTATIVQNLIYGNSASCGGGALAFSNDGVLPAFSVLVANNTIVNNVGVSAAGYSECTSVAQIYPSPGTYGNSNPSSVFVNNIISGSSTYPAVFCDYFGPDTEQNQPIFDHNLLYNASGPIFSPNCTDTSKKYGNIVADPQFVDPANGNFHLQPTSPAIDAGNTSVLQSLAQLIPAPLTKDFDSNPRLEDYTGKGYPIIDMGAYETPGLVDASATSIVLTSSAYYGNAGPNFTLTANLASALGIPTGTISFFLGSTLLGASTISLTGVATLPNANLSPGVHSLYASYPGQGAFTPATSVIIIIDVTNYSTSLQLTASANPAVLGQPVTFTVTAVSGDPSSVPAPITLSANNATIATLTPNSAGVATFTTSSLALGFQPISATYAGDATHSAAQTTLYENIVTGYPTTTTFTCNPSTLYVSSISILNAQVTSASGIPTGSITLTDNGATLTQSALSAGATAAFQYTGQTAGTHTLTASYVPTGSFAGSSASCAVTVSLKPSTLTLASSLNPSAVSQTVTFTANVAYGGPPQSFAGYGSVTFTDGAATLATLPLTGTSTVGSGTATFSTSTLAAGTHTITATLNPLPGYAPASASLSQVVTGLGASATLAVTPTTTTFGSPVILTANIQPTNPPGPSAPTGTITFFVDGSTAALPVPLSSSAASLSLSTLSAGQHQVTCTYSGDSTYDAAPCNAVVVTVNAASTALTLSSSVNPSNALSPISFTAILTSAGQPSAGNPVTLTLSLPGSAPIVVPFVSAANGASIYTTDTLSPGTYTVTAAFAGTANLSGSSATLTEIVVKTPSTTALTVSPSPAYQGQTVAFASIVYTANGRTPTGSITFLDGAAPLVTVPLAFARAALNLSTLAPGLHNLTASYSGDTNYLPSVSPIVPEQVLSSDFALSSTPAALTLVTGHHTTFAVSAASIGIFSDSLQLNALSLPPHVTVTIQQQALGLAQGAQASTSIYLDTDDVVGYLSRADPASPTRHPGPPAWAAFPFASLLLLASRRRALLRRSRLASLLLCLVAATGLAALSGCSGKYPASTAPGTYSIQINAIGANTRTTHILTIPLTVTE